VGRSTLVVKVRPVEIKVGLVLASGYLDMFCHDSPVERGGSGGEGVGVDSFEGGAGFCGSPARTKAMWSGSSIIPTKSPRASTHSSVDHEAPKQVVLRSSQRDMQYAAGMGSPKAKSSVASRL
jgi:hypothetical protein